MAQYFFDTSAFVKFYHSEVGTPKVSAIFAELNRVIRISSIGVLEIQSAFAMKVSAGATRLNSWDSVSSFPSTAVECEERRLTS